MRNRFGENGIREKAGYKPVFLCKIARISVFGFSVTGYSIYIRK